MTNKDVSESGSPIDPNSTFVPAEPAPAIDPLATNVWSGVLDAIHNPQRDSGQNREERHREGEAPAEPRAPVHDTNPVSARGRRASDLAATMPDSGELPDQLMHTIVPAMKANDDPEAFFAQTIGARQLDDDDNWDAASPPGPRQVAQTAGPARRGSTNRPPMATAGQAAASIDIEKIISIRSRPVSGDGPFTPTDDADYEIIEKLAEGGMGVVYVARQRSLNRELAIKTLKQAGGSGSGSSDSRGGSGTKAMTRAERSRRDMFFSEAVVTANLVHPNIVPIHDLCETESGMPYYVMKRVHGTPWNKRIRELSLPENLAILDRVCDAIAYAHHHGVINRDLKPENVMLGEFGEVMVLDWGLAVPAAHATDVNFQSPNATSGAGTPAYMAPELWTGPMSSIRETADIYLLGAMLFETITGFPPHQFPAAPRGGTVLDTWNSIDQVLRNNTIRETTHAGELIEIAFKAMRTAPDQRHGSVLEFQFAIRNFQRHEESRNLSQRASDLMKQDASLAGYQSFQTASALFEESLRTWPKNTLAQSGLRSTRLAYAKLAGDKGDYDLAIQVADQEDSSEFQSLRQKFRSAKRLRSSVKWTAFAAMLCVVLLGAKSVYDNGVITNLNEEVTVRKDEARTAVAEAEVARTAAEQAQRDADTAADNARVAIAQADEAKAAADAARTEADRSREEAKLATTAAADANAEAARALADATRSKSEAAEAVAAAETANQQAELAEQKVAAAEVRETEARNRQDAAETAARVAQVEIQTQSVRSLTLNQNYSDALREIERLLEGELLTQLPEDVRQQRTIELQAQRAQLLKRAKLDEVPVQTQAVSPDGRWIATGDAAGVVTVIASPNDSLEWPRDSRAKLQLPAAIASVSFADADTLLIATGRTVQRWKIGQPAAEAAVTHSGLVRALKCVGDRMVVASESGTVTVHELSGALLHSINVRTSIRDVALLSDARTLLVAGSRGGQSADVFAWRLPQDAVVGSEPDRLGQMMLDREQSYPPLKLAVSPDDRLLVMSNSRNGDLIAIAAVAVSDAARNRFPFAHPAELSSTGNQSWLLQQHDRPVNSLAWSSDGNRVLSASDDRTVGVWDRTAVESNSVESRSELELVRVLKGHGARVVEAVSLNSDGTRIATASADRYSRLWDLTSQDDDERKIFEAFKLTAQREGSRRAGAAEPLSASHRDTRAAKMGAATLTRLNTEGLCPAARQVVSRDDDATVLNGDRSQHRGAIADVCTTHDGTIAITAAADGSVAMWNTASGSLVRQIDTRAITDDRELFREGHEFNVARMQHLSSPAPLLITAGFDGTLRLWNMDLDSGSAGVQRQSLTGLGLVNAFAVSDDGRWIVTSASGDEPDADLNTTPVVRMWAIESLLAHQQESDRSLSNGSKAEVTALAFSPDSQFVAGGARDGRMSIWRVADGSLVAQARGHLKNTIISGVHWLSVEEFVTAGLDGQLLKWRFASESLSDPPVLNRTSVLDVADAPIEQLSVSPGGKSALMVRVVTDRQSKRSMSHLWSLDLSGYDESHAVPLATIQGVAPTQISSVSWSADGTRTLVCANRQLHMLNTTNWETLRVVEAQGLGITAAQFVAVADAAEKAVSFDGNSASLWDLASGNRIVQFRGPAAVSRVAVSSDAEHRLVVTGGECLRGFEARVDHPKFGQPLFRADQMHAAPISALAEAGSGEMTFASGDAEGTVVVWSWNEADARLVERYRIAAAVRASIVQLMWLDHSDELLAVSASGSLRRILDGAVLSEWNCPPNLTVMSADMQADSSVIAVVGEDRSNGESVGFVLSTSTNDHALRIFSRLTGHSAGGITAVRFLDGTPWIVTGGADGAVIVTNWQSPLPGELPQAYEALRMLAPRHDNAHQSAVSALARAASGDFASASADGTAIVWNSPFERASNSVD